MKALLRSVLVIAGLRAPIGASLRLTTVEQIVEAGLKKAHYGSGGRLLEGWVNLDLGNIAAPNYLKADLTELHPFPDGWFRFGFAEDFLEHLDQEQSLRFLIEVYRTLQPSGVLRLSFPGLEGVLRKHYRPPTHSAATLASAEAYSMWGHRHFYSREELQTVAQHIGYRAVRFVEVGRSEHPELCGLDHRLDQADLNTCVELMK